VIQIIMTSDTNQNQSQTQQKQPTDLPFWQRATPSERAKEFQEWVKQLPKTNVSLPNEAFDRSQIYD
jgi:hypothetical protein